MEAIFNSMKSIRIRISLIVVIATMNFQACSFFKVSYHEDTKTAKQLYRTLLETNQHIGSCKGIVKTSTHGFDFQLNERLAFISQQKHNLRVEMLSPFGAIGSPFMLICNEKKVYATGRLLPDTYLANTHSIMLKQMLPIQMTPREIIDCLHGRIPISKGMRARFDSKSSQKTLILSKGLIWKTRNKIFLNNHNNQVQSVEKYNRFNQLIYRILFEQYRDYQNETIPGQITFVNASNQSLTINIQSYWPNCTIKNKSFQINKNDQQNAEKGVFSCLVSFLTAPVRYIKQSF